MPSDPPRVYFDANILIYALEHEDQRGRLARSWLLHAETGEIQFVTSEITLAEVLAQPIERGQHELVEAYQLLLTTRPFVHLAAVDRATILSAARLRAGLKLGLPDALHVATALEGGCEDILTEDTRMKVPLTLRKLSLHDLPESAPHP
jgi:predicted nucleic acid-binding protein